MSDEPVDMDKVRWILENGGTPLPPPDLIHDHSSFGDGCNAMVPWPQYGYVPGTTAKENHMDTVAAGNRIFTRDEINRLPPDHLRTKLAELAQQAADKYAASVGEDSAPSRACVRGRVVSCAEVFYRPTIPDPELLKALRASMLQLNKGRKGR